MTGTVTRHELSDYFACSTRTLDQLSKRGILARRGHGAYDLRDSTRSYISHLRAVAGNHAASDGKISLIEERAKLARAQTEEAELRIATRRGEFIPRPDVARALQGIVRVIRQHVLAIPGRFTFRVPDVHKAELQILNEVTRDALSSIAKTSPDDVFKPSAD